MSTQGADRRRTPRKEKAAISIVASDDESAVPNNPLFLPLEATTERPPPHLYTFEYARKYVKACNGKKVVSLIMISLICLVLWDAVFTAPEKRILKRDFADTFLRWVQANPVNGLFAFVAVIAAAVVLLIPIGTPLTLGCGYIYKAAYGWTWGLMVATAVSMTGSALGAIACFLLGRYLMRDQVRLWIRKYPLFDAIDIAAAEHGLRIMAMLYLTPILPLGPVSYMCGTTSMALSHFVLAKVASLPLMFFYVFIGASTGALLGPDPEAAVSEEQAIESNTTLIISGILLSVLMIGGITHFIKKELDKILVRQGKRGVKDDDDDDLAAASEESSLEMGVARTKTRHRKGG